MKKALIALLALSTLTALIGCGNPEEKALETSAPKISENASTFEAGGGEPKPIGERDATDGPQGPAEKPPGY